MAESTANGLWLLAGGGTPEYSAARYRELLTEHGLLVPLGPGEVAEQLPCGWPVAGPREARKPRRDPQREDDSA